MSARARERVIRDFSMDAMVRNCAKLHREVAGAK
jgi:hypothetical protein